MRLEEFMIGDWVMQICVGEERFNHPIKIGLHELIRVQAALSNSDDRLDVKPIPLTPEILEKNNFLKVIWQGRRCTAITTYAIGEGFNLEEDNDGFNLVDNCSDSGDYGYESNYICDIKYVHELQHALKLCGIEKTIEL